MLLTLSLLAAEAVAPPLAPAEADPLARARRGLIECTQPDEAAKTCRSIARYTLNRDGTYQTVAEVLLGREPPVTFETTAQSSLEGPWVCGRFEEAAVRGGKLRVNGSVVPEEQAAPAREKLVAAMAAMFGRKICVSYHASGAGFIERGRIEGNGEPMPDSYVMWVAPDAGYRVAPPPQ